MKAALDVYYLKDHATAACVIFDHWTDSAPVRIVRSDIPDPEPYRAGGFYLRELPCLLAVLREAAQSLDTIVIDGYVHLRPEIGKGLGHHLSAAFHHARVVVGVAKNPLKMADRFIPIHRGRSR